MWQHYANTGKPIKCRYILGTIWLLHLKPIETNKRKYNKTFEHNFEYLKSDYSKQIRKVYLAVQSHRHAFSCRSKTNNDLRFFGKQAHFRPRNSDRQLYFKTIACCNQLRMKPGAIFALGHIFIFVLLNHLLVTSMVAQFKFLAKKLFLELIYQDAAKMRLSFCDVHDPV